MNNTIKEAIKRLEKVQIEKLQGSVDSYIKSKLKKGMDKKDAEFLREQGKLRCRSYMRSHVGIDRTAARKMMDSIELDKIEALIDADELYEAGESLRQYIEDHYDKKADGQLPNCTAMWLIKHIVDLTDVEAGSRLEELSLRFMKLYSQKNSWDGAGGEDFDDIRLFRLSLNNIANLFALAGNKRQEVTKIIQNAYTKCGRLLAIQDEESTCINSQDEV